MIGTPEALIQQCYEAAYPRDPDWMLTEIESRHRAGMMGGRHVGIAKHGHHEFAEIEAGLESEDSTMLAVPKELVPQVRALLAGNQSA